MASFMHRHIEAITQNDDTSVATIQGRPVMLLRMTGAKSGNEVSVPLMRVEHDGSYLAVASDGGAERDPRWRINLDVTPELSVQDGTVRHDVRARRLAGDERTTWWARAVEAFPQYGDYATRTTREIPIYLLEPR